MRPICYRLALGILFLTPAPVFSQAQPPNAFDIPRIRKQQGLMHQKVSALLNIEDYETARAVLRLGIKRVPHDSRAHYRLACVQAKLKNKKEALASLRQAVEFGFRDRGKIESDSDLAILHDDKAWPMIINLASQPLGSRPAGWVLVPQFAQSRNGMVVVTPKNVRWDPNLSLFKVLVKSDPKNGEMPVAVGLGETGKLLRKWYAAGTAVGNVGMLYDNHDKDHSNMDYAALPQLTRVEYGDEAKQRNLHNGLQRWMIFNSVTIGNSSTALTSGPFWRSQGRAALTQGFGAARLYAQYRSNQLYVYPEHRDHDSENSDHRGKGHGDVFPANTPYFIISQGSSGSDRAFLNAIAQTLASFHPDVKAKLVKHGMLMSVAQMVFRWNNQGIGSAARYRSGEAHPTAFDGKKIRSLDMLRMAHAMTPQKIPPFVAIQVVEEDEALVGRDYFSVHKTEKLFDTPCAVGRVLRATRYQRRFVVSAEQSEDLNGKRLQIHWSLLRGDPERVKITPLGERGERAEILVDYHPLRPIKPGSKLKSRRVDIGVFADNGDYHSAPAFLSLLFPGQEQRQYDADGRILKVDYQGSPDEYIDPAIILAKDWCDEYKYDDQGKLIGWTRIRGNGEEEFTANGKLKSDEDLPASTVQYVVGKAAAGKAPRLVQVNSESK